MKTIIIRLSDFEAAILFEVQRRNKSFKDIWRAVSADLP